ncbi:MAG: hypothetical protein NT098_05490 [Candidatus Parcubacteria bacterium]|nr:hypothetical protein [Candidatus Parcubacteria bacterium]
MMTKTKTQREFEEINAYFMNEYRKAISENIKRGLANRKAKNFSTRKIDM